MICPCNNALKKIVHSLETLENTLQKVKERGIPYITRALAEYNDLAYRRTIALPFPQVCLFPLMLSFFPSGTDVIMHTLALR